MNTPLLVLFIITAVLSIIPGWLTGSIIKKYADKEGIQVWDWIPLALLPYAIGEFKHPNKFAIVWGYIFCNLLFFAALVAIIVVAKFGGEA